MDNSQIEGINSIIPEAPSKKQQEHQKENPEKKDIIKTKSTQSKPEQMKKKETKKSRQIKAMDVPNQQTQKESEKSQNSTLKQKQQKQITSQIKKEESKKSHFQFQKKGTNQKSSLASNKNENIKQTNVIKNINKAVAHSQSNQRRSKVEQNPYSHAKNLYEKKKESQTTKNFRQRFQKMQQQPNKHISNPKKNQMQNENKAKLKKQQQMEQQRVPCSFCDKLITFAQMDDHHDNCQMAFRCQNCKDIFLLVTLEDHYRICNRKKKYHQPKRVQNQHNDKPSFHGNKRKQQQKEYQKKQKRDFIDDQQLFQQQVILEHPDINSKYLREHILAEQQNQFNNKNKSQEFEDSLEDVNLDYDYEQSKSDNEYYNQPSFNYDEDNQSDYHSNNIQGLKAYEIDNLVSDIYQKRNNNEDQQCSICTKQKEDGQHIIRLPCLHTFHADCLIPWLQVKSTCPICKFNLKKK